MERKSHLPAPHSKVPGYCDPKVKSGSLMLQADKKSFYRLYREGSQAVHPAVTELLTGL